MNLECSEADRVFQAKARVFINKHWPESARNTIDGRSRPAPRAEDVSRWFQALVAAGWSVPAWPEKHGGCNWSAGQKYIWDKEQAAAGCPQMSPFGARMLAPVLYTWGTEEQQERFLPSIRTAKTQWCQGYSEPGAGSDLAALCTKAEKVGAQHYLVNGVKTWATGAHRADWMFCLVRTSTDVDKRELGISFLLIDMRSEGIRVEPIVTLGGLHSVNKVTLENVRVPVEQRVGEEGQGWAYAKSLLTHDRTGIAGVARSQAELVRLRRIAAETTQGTAVLAEDAGFQSKVNALEIELMALEMTELRVLAQVAQGASPGPESSILEIKGTEIAQRLAALLVEAHGYYAIPYPETEYLDNEGSIGPQYATASMRSLLMGGAPSIFGATNEIQRNMVAKSVLGL